MQRLMRSFRTPKPGVTVGHPIVLRMRLQGSEMMDLIVIGVAVTVGIVPTASVKERVGEHETNRVCEQQQSCQASRFGHDESMRKLEELSEHFKRIAHEYEVRGEAAIEQEAAERLLGQYNFVPGLGAVSNLPPDNRGFAVGVMSLLLHNFSNLVVEAFNDVGLNADAFFAVRHWHPSGFMAVCLVFTPGQVRIDWVPVRSIWTELPSKASDKQRVLVVGSLAQQLQDSIRKLLVGCEQKFEGKTAIPPRELVVGRVKGKDIFLVRIEEIGSNGQRELIALDAFFSLLESVISPEALYGHAFFSKRFDIRPGAPRLVR